MVAIRHLAAQRNLPQHIVVSVVEDALALAYKNNSVTKGQEVDVQVDIVTGDVKIFTAKRVVDDEDLRDENSEITLSEARLQVNDIESGTLVHTGQLKYNAGRTAAHLTRQMITQRLQQAEQNIVYDEYVSKEGTIVSGRIFRGDRRRALVDIGDGTIASLPVVEQTPTERYRTGQQFRFLLLRVTRGASTPEIVLSRSHPDLLRRLFEAEVPEIAEGTVVIQALAREPGARSKVAVKGTTPDIDAVGACVGLRGIRIQSIVNELLGEKIDVVEWDDSMEKLIANSLSPATVNSVIIDSETLIARVMVPQKYQSLAIGRDGQNARLASRLTNCAIEIIGVSDEAGSIQKSEASKISEVAKTETTTAVEENQASTDGTSKTSAVDISGQATEKVVDESKLKAQPVESRHTEAPAEEIPEEVATESKEKEEDAVTFAHNENEELLAIERELAELERHEEAEARERAAQEKKPQPVSSDDIWKIDFGNNSNENLETELTFAEDLNLYREQTGSSKQRSSGNRRKKR